MKRGNGWDRCNAALVALLTVVAACGPRAGGAGEKVRPIAPTAEKALETENAGGGSTCTEVSPHARPFLADWSTDQRAELAAAMSSGVAVIHYDCKGIKVLPDCKLEGKYELARIPATSEERIIEESDDLSATIPIAAVSIGAEMSRGLKLRLKYALVGRKGTAIEEVMTSDIKGSCDGATHFLRAALLGAFKFGTATEGSVGGGVKVLGAGADGVSKSARQMTREAGEPDACGKATIDGPGLPNGCEHVVQVQLGPVVGKLTKEDEQGGAGEGAPKAEKARNPCTAGYVLSSKGECKKKNTAGAYLCDPKNVEECEQQCEKGSAESCQNAAYGQYEKLKKQMDASMRDDKTDPAMRAIFRPRLDQVVAAEKPFHEKGCTLKHLPSCVALAHFLQMGKGPDRARALTLFQQGCEGGQATACVALARNAESGGLSEDVKFRPQPLESFKFMAKACALGDGYACSEHAKNYIDGKGTLKNPQEGVKALERSCTSGITSACVELARLLATGEAGVTKDPSKALGIYVSTCENRQSAPACIGAADLNTKGVEPVKKNPAEGKRFLEHACNNLSHQRACVTLGEMIEKGVGTDKDPKAALAIYEKACPKDSPSPRTGCLALGRLYETGGNGVDRKPNVALEAYLRGCISYDFEKTGIPLSSCRKALARQKELSPADLRRVVDSLCSYKDAKACEQQKKLGPAPVAQPVTKSPPPTAAKSNPPAPPAKP